jgi:hypothetical protein
LRNVIERSVIVRETENLSADESWLMRRPGASETKSDLKLADGLASQEKEMMEDALRESGASII